MITYTKSLNYHFHSAIKIFSLFDCYVVVAYERLQTYANFPCIDNKNVIMLSIKCNIENTFSEGAVNSSMKFSIEVMRLS